jgi:hypothetical protein
MSLEIKLAEFAAAVGTDIKSIIGSVGSLSALSTTEKTNLVAAINEIKQAQANATGIDDVGAGSTTTTYSSSKINDLIAQAIGGIIGSSPTALDTLNELAAALGNDENFAANVILQLDSKVGVSAQSFTEPQKSQARSNIGAASETALTTFQSAVGDTEVDLLAIYTTAKT